MICYDPSRTYTSKERLSCLPNTSMAGRWRVASSTTFCNVKFEDDPQIFKLLGDTSTFRTSSAIYLCINACSCKYHHLNRARQCSYDYWVMQFHLGRTEVACTLLRRDRLRACTNMALREQTLIVLSTYLAFTSESMICRSDTWI